MLITDVTRRGQRELARLLDLRARLGRRAGRARGRGGRLRRLGHRRAAARRRAVPVRGGPGRAHPGGRLARGREHGRAGRRDGVRLPVACVPADRASRGLMAATAQSLREQVAWACRILALEGYADLTLGHVSGRPEGDDIVQIKRKGVALDEVDADDVIELDLTHDEVPPHARDAPRGRAAHRGLQGAPRRRRRRARPSAVRHGVRRDRRDARDADARLGAVLRRARGLRGDAGDDHRGRRGQGGRRRRSATSAR